MHVLSPLLLRFLLHLCMSSAAFAAFISLIASGSLRAQIVLNWRERTDVNVLLPSSIRVFEGTGTLPSGRNIRANYAEIRRDAEVRAIAANGLTPTDALAAGQAGTLLAINGGFFTTPSASIPSGSVSMIVTDSVLITRNLASLTRPGENNVNATFYPTRCAFGILQGGGVEPEVTWVYTPSGGVGARTFSYPNPSPNVVGTAPQPVPSESFPPGAREWRTVMAIGGVPMLVKDGRKITSVSIPAELTPTDLPPANPRTCIGYRADGTIILLTIDGRQTFSAGADLEETAEIMLGLRCVGAINLDGGGSTTMVAHTGQSGSMPGTASNQFFAVNIPVDRNLPGTQRAVGSAVVVRSRQPYTPLPTTIFTTLDRTTYSERGTWTNAPERLSYGTSTSRVAAAGSTTANVAVFRLSGIRTGRYQVSAWWTVADDRATNTPITVFSAGTATTVAVNQSDPITANKWNVLGEFRLTANDSVVISSTAASSPNTLSPRICANAVRLVLLQEATSVQNASAALVDAASEHTTSDAVMHANYPNPFAESTTISFTLNKPARVNVRIYDALGRVVQSLWENVFAQAGRHELRWEPDETTISAALRAAQTSTAQQNGLQGISSGVYICIVESSTGARLRQILVKQR